jgi:hypothetical protein
MLNSEETQIIDKLEKRGRIKGRLGNLKDVKVGYQFCGNFTNAVIEAEDGIRIGTSKRNPGDETNNVLGKRLAFHRALINEPIKFRKDKSEPKAESKKSKIEGKAAISVSVRRPVVKVSSGDEEKKSAKSSFEILTSP